MKNLFIRIAQFAVVALFALNMSSCSYNSFVEQEEAVNKAWADVQAQYQRRVDLFGNLVATVKKYAEHESKTYKEITEARSAISNAIKIEASELDEETLAKIQNKIAEANKQLNSGLGRLIAVSENYPELKASELFRDLQAQIEGTENRIAVARTDFNGAVQTYNTAIREFPGLITAKIFGFKAKSMFKADIGAENAPSVSNMFE